MNQIRRWLGSRRVRAAVFASLGVASAAGSGWWVLDALGDVRLRAGEGRVSVEMRDAALAVGDLEVGVPIDAASVIVGRVPVSFHGGVPPLSVADVVGRVPRERILSGEVIAAARLADARTGAGLNALVPVGSRALSVNIARGAAISGFLQPGHRVDVVATIADDLTMDAATLTLLQGALVLAVNEHPMRGGEDRARDRKRFQPSVTLAVDPVQAEQLAHAEQRGELRLALRSPLDADGVVTQVVSNADLLPAEPLPAPKAVARRAASRPHDEATLLIIRAGQSSQRRVIDGRVQR